MASSQYLVSISIGSTSASGILCNVTGNILSRATQKYNLDTSVPGQCEVNPAEYWESVIYIIRQLLRDSGVRPSDVKSLAFSCRGSALLAVDNMGKPLRNAFAETDSRSSVEALAIKERFGKLQFVQKTGQQDITPAIPAARILWIRKNEPEVFNNTYKFICEGDYLVHCLTGRFVTEPSVVSSSFYYDITRNCWWSEMLDFIGTRPVMFPEIIPAGSRVGKVSPDAARLTGLNEQTCVVTGAYSYAALAIGSGNIHPGMLTESTEAAITMLVTQAVPVQGEPMCRCHALPGMYFSFFHEQPAGILLDWFRDQLGSQLKEIAADYRLDIFDLLTGMASQVPPGSDGLILLPYHTGGGSSGYKLSVTTTWTGITPATTKAHLIRSILEAVAALIRKNINSLSAGKIGVNEILSIGWGARSSVWNQIKADMTGIPVMTMQSETVQALGTAILAGVGAGIFQTVEEGCHALLKEQYRFEPNIHLKPVYDEVFRKYTLLYEQMAPFWK